MIAAAAPVEIPASENSGGYTFTAEEIRSDIVNSTDTILDESRKVKKRTTIILSLVVAITAIATAIFAPIAAVVFAIPLLYLWKSDYNFSQKLASLKIQLQQKLLGSIAKDVHEKTTAILTDGDINNKSQEEDVQKTVLNHFERVNSDGHVRQFIQDAKRDLTFIIQDHLMSDTQIEALPASTLPPNERVKIVTTAISKLSDATWIKAVETVCNQTPLVNFLGHIIGQFTCSGTDHTWTDKDQNTYSLKAAMSSAQTPIQMNVVRDVNKSITRIEFTVENSLDIIKKDMETAEASPALSKAITGKATFSLTLDEEGKPVIGDYQSFITTNFPD
jgi:hypothetical protein